MSPFAELDEQWLRDGPGAKWGRVASDVLPAWVADMDFPSPEPVRRALHSLVETANLGYPDWPTGTPLREAFTDRMRSRYDWPADPGQVREVDDVVGAAQLALRLGTAGGDAIAVHMPCYPPFHRSITRFDRTLLPIPMIDTGAGWTFDGPRLDGQLAGARALLLVNPHNPTGRVFTRDELSVLAEAAHRHDLLVISDEIHADLAYPPHRHTPFASINAAAAARTVTLTSATKAFGLAGVRCAVAHIGPRRLLEAWDDQPPNLHGVANVFGVAATMAAWRNADGWLAELVAHLDGQRRLIADTIAGRLPAARYHPPEAGYLAWIDFRGLDLGPDPAAMLLERGRVQLSSGPDFGDGGDGFARLNFGTSTGLLRELLDRLVCAAGPLRLPD
ncbi:MAG: aminotransferase class I/II-fold pyridoxal phosphate-dependent enzyme [Actinomycetota bacterium]|nr:aminotransferase class I/II-fold pyridoxal phosphate-dependent enzyme [Actinomycetota bacterium]